ncbi:hypothetical protein [Aeromicrobium panaciterrae]|uniref:phage tail protein n=1 Tax=Aeromicrobium panaciterrae TaxID=363861 RepID=UPI0031D4A7A0
MKAFAERVESEIKIEIPVHLDRDSFGAELEILEAQVNAAEPVLDVGIDVDGTGALEHLEIILDAMQGTASLHDIDVAVDLDVGGATAELAAFTGATAAAGAGSGFIGRQIALWGPLIFVAAVGIAALAPALAVIFPLVAGIALGVGAIALGWDSVKDTFKPITNAIKDMKKEIGGVLTDGLGPLISTFVKNFIPVLTQGLTIFAGLFNTAAKGLLGFLNSGEGLDLMSQLVVGLGKAFAPFASLIGPLAEVFLRLSIAALPALQMMGDALLEVTTQFADFLTGTSGPSNAITDSMSELGDVLGIIGKLIKDLFPPLVDAAPGVISMLEGIGEVIGQVFKALQPLFQFMSDHTTTMKIIGAVLAGVAIALGLVAAAALVVGLVTASAATIIAAAIGAVIGFIIYAYNEWETFRNIVDAVISAVVFGVAFMVELIKIAFNAIVAYIQWAIGFWIGFGTAVGNAIGTAIDWVVGLPEQILDAVTGFGDLLLDAGRDLIQGLIDGAEEMVDVLMDTVRNIAGGAVDAVKGIFHIHSPSKVFHQIGVYVMQGLVDGLEAGTPEVEAAFDQLADMVDKFSTIAPSVDFSTENMSPLTRAVDAALISGDAHGPTEMVIRDWSAGKGWMQKTTDEKAAQTEKLNSIDDILGGPE